MQAHQSKLNEIFVNNTIIAVPYFQRSYVWGEDEWKRFISDMEIVTSMNKFYFMGAIILKENNDLDGYTLVDGQQRSTTFMLFLKALALRAGMNHAFSYQYLYCDDENQPILMHNVHDKQDFDRIMTSDAWFETGNGCNTHIMKAYKYFQDYVKLLTPAAAAKMFKAINKHVEFVKIVLAPGEDEQQTFNTINSMGVNLTTGELLKNYLFSKSNESLYNSKWAPVFDLCNSEYWANALVKGSTKDTNTECFFNALLQMIMWRFNLSACDKKLFRKRDRLYASYCSLVENEEYDIDKNALIEEIVKFAKMYRENFREEVLIQYTPTQACLQRLCIFMYASKAWTMVPYVLYILNEGLSQEEQNKIFGYLESYLMRRMVCKSKNNNYSDFFSENMINQGINTYDKLKAYVEAKPQNDALAMPTDEDVLEGVLGNDLQKESALILFMLGTASMGDRMGLYDDFFADYVSEQIMPSKWDSVNWPSTAGFSDEERAALVNTLGNMCLLQMDKKVTGKVHKMGWMSKCAQLEPFAQDAITSGVFDAYGTWTENDILARGRELAAQINKVWKA